VDGDIYTIFAHGVDEIATDIWHNTDRSVVEEFLEVSWRDVQGLTLGTGGHALLQDLTKDSATLTRRGRTHQSGEWKIIVLYVRRICYLRYRFSKFSCIFFAFRNFPENLPVKNI
jgi:hypothetical protein